VAAAAELGHTVTESDASAREEVIGFTVMKRMIQIPYELEQEEDGTWGAHASFPRGGAHGLGSTPEEAVADLYEAVSLVIEEFGMPPVLTVVQDVA
jgi:predicted RNase H-like HicB family nuclease